MRPLLAPCFPPSFRQVCERTSDFLLRQLYVNGSVRAAAHKPPSPPAAAATKAPAAPAAADAGVRGAAHGSFSDFLPPIGRGQVELEG